MSLVTLAASFGGVRGRLSAALQQDTCADNKDQYLVGLDIGITLHTHAWHTHSGLLITAGHRTISGQNCYLSVHMRISRKKCVVKN